MSESSPERKQITVVVADDHTVVREGTRRLLEGVDDISVVGEAADGETAFEEALRLHPDVLVMDIRMPGMNGLEVAVRLKEEGLATKVFFLSAYDDDAYVAEAMEFEAAGYLLKTAKAKELQDGVRAAAQGQVVLDPAIAKKVAKLISKGQSDESNLQSSLTPRDKEVLQLVARGLRNKEIAMILGMGSRTVEGHLNNIFAKLNVSTRTEAVVYGISQGWITPAIKDKKEYL